MNVELPEGRVVSASTTSNLPNYLLGIKFYVKLTSSKDGPVKTTETRYM